MKKISHSQYFEKGDRVRYFGQFEDKDGRHITREIKATIEEECNGRPGWYYVRHIESGYIDMVEWSDLMPSLYIV